MSKNYLTEDEIDTKLGGTGSFSHSWGTKGYALDPQGFIVLWGTTTCPGNSNTTAYFSKTFPTSVLSVVANPQTNNTSNSEGHGVNSLTRSSFSILNADGKEMNFYWIAVGY